MTIQYLNKVKDVTGERGINLLDKLFEQSRDTLEGVNADRFRADHPSDLSLLDNLTSNGLLTDRWKEGKLYRPTVYALPLLYHERSKQILGQSNTIITYLRDRYIEKLGETLVVSEIAYELSIDYGEIAETFLYMRDGHSWICGCSLSFPFGDDFPFGESATITICENILKNSSFDEIINSYYEWHYMQKKDSIASALIESLNIKPRIFGISIDLKKLFDSIYKQIIK